MLHQKSQRRICRSLFLLACLAPTMLVLGAIARRTHPGFQHDRVQNAAQWLGARLECDDLTTLRPGEESFSGLRLLHPETGALLATLDSLSSAPGQGSAARAGVLRIEPGRLDAVAGLLCDALRGGFDAPRSLEIAEIRLGDATLARDAVLSLEAPRNGAVALVIRESTTGRALSLVRNRQVDPPTTRLSLETGGRALPWAWLSGLAPLPVELGADAGFTGRLTLELESRHGRLTGDIDGVDIAALAPAESLLSTRLPGRLADVDLAWRGERFTSVQLVVVAGAGEIGWVFLDNARYGLKCSMIGPLEAAWKAANSQQAYPAEAVAFDQLAMRVTIDTDGCRVAGLLPDANGSHCVMRRDGQDLLVAPGVEAATLEDLAQITRSLGASRWLSPAAAALLARLPQGEEAALRR